MGPTKTKTSSKKEIKTEGLPWLSEHPWMGILVLLFLYMIFLIVPNLLYALLATSTFYITHIYIIHLLDFFGVALLFVIVVPFVLGIPNGRKYSDYVHSIRIFNLKPVFRTIVLGLIGAMVILALMLFSTYLTTLTSPTGQIVFEPSLLINPSTINIYTSFTPGIWEEVAFRGIILILLLKLYSERTSIILNGILFGLFHVLNLVIAFLYAIFLEVSIPEELVPQVLFQIIYTAFLGFSLAYLFIKANSLIPCIIIHYLVDGLSTLVGSATGVEQWKYLLFVTFIGFGILPAKINILIIRSCCHTWPQPFDVQVKSFDTFLARKENITQKKKVKSRKT